MCIDKGLSVAEELLASILLMSDCSLQDTGDTC